MAGVSLTSALRQQYEELFETCSISSSRVATVESIINKLEVNQNRYTLVAGEMGIPWFFIAAIHQIESDRDFTTHLHNGDPLTARTTHVPSGRPKTGSPPFSWEESAKDALTMNGLGGSTDWSLAGVLYQLERYNGWGYRQYHPYVLSPYLWSFSNHYSSGKYVADGTWSDTAVSNQCGSAVILRRMSENGLISFVDQPIPPDDSPLISSYSKTKPTEPTVLQRAKDLQVWLNTFPGIFLMVDGWPADKTSNAFHKVVSIYLPGDPRG